MYIQDDAHVNNIKERRDNQLKAQKEILFEMINALSEKMIESEKLLTDLDSAIGDGDCGLGIKTGFQKVQQVLPTLQMLSMGGVLKKVGSTLVGSIGGTSGAILGTGFMRLGKSLGDKENIDLKDMYEALENALLGMQMRGEDTKVGDKTLVDALQPAVEAFKNAVSSGENGSDALTKAVSAARVGSDSTIPLIARKGRASYLGERSIGHRDAGSMGIFLMFESINNYLRGQNEHEENY